MTPHALSSVDKTMVLERTTLAVYTQHAARLKKLA
jgi:hypothetical protein